MMTEKMTRKRFKVRAENPDCACGDVGHMTVDELKKHLTGDEVNLACPACGQVHLTQSEIEEIAKEKISRSRRYKEIQSQAEAAKNR